MVLAGIVTAVGGIEDFLSLWERLAGVKASYWKWRAIRAELDLLDLERVEIRHVRAWVKEEDTVRDLARASTDGELVRSAGARLAGFWKRRGLVERGDDNETAEAVVEVLLRFMTGVTDFEVAVRSHLELITDVVAAQALTLGQSAEVVEGSDLSQWLEDDRWGLLLRSHIVDNTVPAYIDRELDTEISARLAGAVVASDPESDTTLWDRFVFVSGNSKCGKTRSLLQALQRLAQTHDIVVYQPRNADFGGLAERVRRYGLEPQRNAVKVVLLDDLQFYEQASGPLAESPLLAPLDDQLPRFAELCFSPTPERILIVGTVWPDYLSGSPGQLRQRGDDTRHADAVLQLKSRALRLPVDLTDTEYAQARRLFGDLVDDDEVLRALAPTMAAVPEMLAQIEAAYENPAALTRRATLEGLLVAFLINSQGLGKDRLHSIVGDLVPVLESSEIAAEIQWALTPPVSGPWAFAVGHDQWRLADPLVADMMTRLNHQTAAAQVSMTPHEAKTAGLNAYIAANGPTTKSIPYWTQAATDTDPDPLLFIAATLGELGRSDEAIGVYDEVITRFGDHTEPAITERVAMAMFNKGVRLGALGRSDEAIGVYDEVITRFGDHTGRSVIVAAVQRSRRELDRLNGEE
ncbi:MAG: hypothetical protein GY925_14690 [Actinomycetia bacterium]|nr:hypothetical protein [Actinomycetes bacterium]